MQNSQSDRNLSIKRRQERQRRYPRRLGEERELSVAEIGQAEVQGQPGVDLARPVVPQ